MPIAFLRRRAVRLDRGLTRGLALVAVLLASPFAATAASPKLPDPMDEELSSKQRLEALIERVKHAQRGAQTLEARFVQTRESELLKEPETASGVFSYRSEPDRVRWEYLEPNPISVVLDGREMITWYRDLDRAEKLQIGRYSTQVFKYLGAAGSMETLVDYFRVKVRFPGEEEDSYRLQLLPKYERITEKLDSMTVWIDPDSYFPNRIRYVSADGESTEYRFEDFEINSEIPPERFVLDLPPEVDTREVSLGRNAG